MRAIGTINIEDQDKIVLLRNKVLVAAGMLKYSNNESTKMAILISEFSREIYKSSGAFNISIAVQNQPQKELWFSSNSKGKLVLTKTRAFKTFFETIKETAKENNVYSYSFCKVIPSQTQTITAALINKLKTNILGLTEKELLLELEKKNIELTKAYEKLEKSQKELLNKTQEIAKVGGWEVDFNTKAFSMTDEVYRIHDLDPTQSHTFQKILSLYSAKAKTTILEAIKKAEQYGESWDFEFPLLTSIGNRKWIRVIGNTEVSKNKSIRLSGAFQDITLQKAAKLQLARKNKELKFKNKELEQFAYVASHDLQEPLRTINSYVELLGELYKDKLDEDGLRFMMHIENASTRMKILIKDLLDYSRLGREKVFVNVDCNKTVKDVLSDLNTSIKESKAQITVEELPTVVGLEVELKQLFQNLIGNAIKFTDENSAPVIHVSAEKRNKEWVFKIKDQGIGIAEKHLDRIFTIFQRLHSRDKYPGTGIGLALCKKIVDMHGGDIKIESELGVGTTFLCTIKQRNINGKQV